MKSVFSIIFRPSKLAAGNGIYKNVSSGYTNSYQHTIAAFGGYDTAQVNISIRRSELESYLLYALGSDITIMTDETQIVWQGFVNDISISFNGIDINVGPLIDLTNKVLVKYSDFITGVPGVTTYANDLLSQSRYGVFTKILSAASVSAANAENIRNHYLNENKFPFYNMNLTANEDTHLSVSINCLGYYHTLSTYIYNNPLSGSYTVREKIIDVLAAHPANIFGRTSLMQDNTLSVLRLENEDRLAIDVIKGLVAFGSDTSNERMLFGIYDYNSVYYNQIPTQISFYYRNFRNNRYIANAAGGKVNIAALKPGQYIGVNDIPDVMFSGIKSVPKYIFAENVSYSAPYELSITGTNVSTLAQKLAKLGLSGL